MDEDFIRQRRIINICIFVLLLVIAAGLFMLFRAKKHETAGVEHISQPFAQNITFPYKADDSHLYFYTGHSLASLDINTNTTKELSPTYILPTSSPTDLGWSKNGAVIQSSSYTLFDDLGKLTKGVALGSDTRPSYLWYMPFNGKIRVIDKNVTSFYVDQSSDTVYYLSKVSPNADGSSVKAYSIATGSTKTWPTGIPDTAKIVYATGDSFYALAGNGKSVMLVHFNASGNQETISQNVFDSDTATVNSPFLMPTADYFIAANSNTKQASLFGYDVRSGKNTKIVDDFNGTLNKSTSKVFANNTNGNKFIIDMFESPTKKREFSVVQPTGSVSNTFDFSDKYILIDFTNKAYVISGNVSNTSGIPVIKSAGLDKTISNSSAYNVSIDLTSGATSNTYTVNIYAPYQINIDKFMHDSKAAGYDPNQLVLYINYTAKR